MSKTIRVFSAIAVVGLLTLGVRDVNAQEEISSRRLDTASSTEEERPGREQGVAKPQLDVASLTGPMQAASTLLGKMQLESAFERSLASGQPQPIHVGDTSVNTFCWAAPNLYHQPLYFEQAYLERFGVGAHRAFQPWTSGLAFYTRVPLLPLSMLKHPPDSRDYTLGYRRPGDCVTELPIGTGYQWNHLKD